MFKKISFITSVLFFLLGTTVFAQSHLEDSNPKNGEVVTTAFKEIKLSFETNLENISTFTLNSSSGTTVPLSKVTVAGNKLFGTIKEDLKSGAYTIHWKSVDIDGHIIEGVIPFSVQLPAPQTPAASTAPAAQTKGTAPGKNTAGAAIPSEAAKSSAPTFKNYVLPFSVCLFIVIGMASYWLVYRRKHV